MQYYNDGVINRRVYYLTLLHNSWLSNISYHLEPVNVVTPKEDSDYHIAFGSKIRKKQKSKSIDGFCSYDCLMSSTLISLNNACVNMYR